MPETQMKDDSNFKPFAFLDSMYEQSVGALGVPISFNLFDVQVCSHIDRVWLVSQADQCGATKAEVERFVDSGMIRTWTDDEENHGFLLYATQQIKTLKELQAGGRFSDEELRHIMACWDEDIECTLEVVPYDDPRISEIDHYRRRIAEHIDETRRQIDWRREQPPSIGPDDALDRLNSNLQDYEKTARKVDFWASRPLHRK